MNFKCAHSLKWQLAHLIAASALILFTGMVISAPQAFATNADFSTRSAVVDASLNNEGTLAVTEQRVFDFEAETTTITRIFDLSECDTLLMDSIVEKNDNQEIVYTEATGEEALSEATPGTFAITRSDSNLTLNIFLSGNNKDSTKLTFEYTIEGAARRWADTSDFLWRFADNSWGCETKNIEMTLTLPVASGASIDVGSNVNIWTHGPSSAVTSVNENGKISVTCATLAADEFLEVRTLFPSEWLDVLDASDIDKREQIITEEKELADANQVDASDSSVVFWVLFILSIVLSFAAIGVGVFFFIRRDRVATAQQLSNYLRELPSNDHPAVVDAVRNQCKADLRGMTATLLLLSVYETVSVRRATVNVRSGNAVSSRQVYMLVRNRERARYLTGKLETELIEFLFDVIGGGQDTLYLTQINEFVRSNTAAFAQKIHEWKTDVESQANALLQDQFVGRKRLIVMLIAGGVQLIFSIVASIIIGNIIPAIVGVVAAIALTVMSLVVRKDAPRTCKLVLRCEAHYNWLLKFSSIDSEYPYTTDEWNDFIVMATAFGIEGSVLNQLAHVCPQLLNNPDMKNTFSFFSTTGALTSFGTSFTDALEDAYDYATGERELEVQRRGVTKETLGKRVFTKRSSHIGKKF